MYVSSERIFNTRSKEKKLYIALYSAQLSFRGHASYPCIVLPVKLVTFRAERDRKQGWHSFLKLFKIGFQKNGTLCFLRSTGTLTDCSPAELDGDQDLELCWVDLVDAKDRLITKPDSRIQG